MVSLASGRIPLVAFDAIDIGIFARVTHLIEINVCTPSDVTGRFLKQWTISARYSIEHFPPVAVAIGKVE